MSSNDTILTMENITKTFGPVKALTDVNLSVDRGEIHAICGENGAGKSTLMNVLSGVYPYGSYSGKITFDGKECKYHTINDSEADGIVIIHQELALSPFLSIAENIFIGNEQAKGGVIDWDKTRAEAKKLLDRVGLPEDPDTKVMDIGVGKQQLVEIAKALSKDVKLLILDEPTAALNDEDSAHLLDLVRRQLRDEQGVTSIIITHKLNEVAAIADNVTIIRDGSTVGVMYVTPETPLDQEELIRKMVGRPLHNLYPNHPSNTPGEEYLRVEDWTVHHPLDAERVIVDHANINVHAGEIVGLAGLMGAGRTEMAMSISATLTVPTSPARCSSRERKSICPTCSPRLTQVSPTPPRIVRERSEPAENIRENASLVLAPPRSARAGLATTTLSARKLNSTARTSTSSAMTSM